MACVTCQNRKKMIKDAYRQNGVSGVAKELPIVGKRYFEKSSEVFET